MMRSKLCMLLVLGSFSTSSISSEVGPSRFNGFIYNPNGKNFDTVQFDRLPTVQDINRLISPNATVAYRIDWDCAILPNGRVFDCKAQNMWPVEMDIRFVEGLLKKVRLDRRLINKPQNQGARLLLNVYLDNARRRLDSSCPPGWCPILPAPPSTMNRLSPLR